MFGSLIALIRDNRSIINALHAFRASLTRFRLDAKDRLDGFWKTDVAPIFNDEVFQPIEEFSHVLSGIRIDKPPASPKTSEQLRTLHYDIRPDFAVMYSMLCCSGQLEGGPERFKMILLKNSERNFKLRYRQFNVTGRKFLLLLTSWKCGTPEGDNYADLITFLGKSPQN